MDFKAVLFDLDGTLLDTLEDISLSMNAVLSRHGFPTHDMDAYRYFVGDGAGMLVRRAIPERIQDEEIVGKYIKEFLDGYDGGQNLNTRPYPGIEETLNGLSERRIRLAILSNKPHKATIDFVTKFLGKWKFDIVFGERDGVPRKPDPAGALQVARFFELESRKILYVGDTGVDMKTAVAAGMYPVGALWGFRSRDELENSGAKVMIKRPQEILEIVDYGGNE